LPVSLGGPYIGPTLTNIYYLFILFFR
jgi:hypothetical protein